MTAVVGEMSSLKEYTWKRVIGRLGRGDVQIIFMVTGCEVRR